MRLKSLVLKGFKSFADETEINFNENLIGIVGPNGSGKSNIVDAIRWVLGEQKTTELRLEAMADVIFSGTKDRKEGRVARVTLTFDNTKHILPLEFSEVSISRLLYKDGSSEYRLNSVPCRKKDITSLFIDSGIGSNSYAIISLNMVEDILHDSGGSRRRMLEQAAGISKYKIRKKETLAKLRITSEDLDRVEDLLFEIMQNMKAFERQARRTEKFNLLKSEYRELSVNIASLDVQKKSDDLAALKIQWNDLKDKKIALTSTLNLDEANLQQLKTDILAQEKSLSADQLDFNQVIEELGGIENQKNLTLQDLSNHQDKLDKISRDLATTKNAINTGDNAIAKLSAQLKSVEKDLVEAEKKARISSTVFEEYSATYEALRSKERQIKATWQANDQERQEKERTIESLSTRITIIAENLTSIKSRKEELEANLIVGKEKLKALATNLDKEKALEAQITERESKINQILDALRQKSSLNSKAIDKKRLEIAAVHQRRGFLEDIVRKQEGRPEAVKFVLEKNKNIPVLSDILHVTEDKYTPIVELFFEPYFNYLVLENHPSALEIYAGIRAGQKGKLSSFVADSIPLHKPSSIDDDTFIPLESVLSFEQKYSPLIAMLTQNVFICDQAVEEFDREMIGTGQTVLFPKDYLILTGQTITGGSNTLFEGVQLGRKQLIEKLENQLVRLEGESEELIKKEQSFKKEMDENEAEASEIAKTHLSQNEKLRLLIRHQYELESAIGHDQNDLDQIGVQLRQKEEERENCAASLKTKRKELETLNDLDVRDLSDQELADKIQSAFRKFTNATAEKEQLQGEFYQFKNQFEIVARELEFEKISNEQFLTQEKLYSKEHGEISKYSGQLKVDLKEIKEKLSKTYAKKEIIQKKLNQYEDSYYKEKGNIFELEKKISTTRNQILQIDHQTERVKDKVSALEFDIKGIRERIKIEFNTELIEEVSHLSETGNIDEWIIQKNKIQAKIQGFGEINPMAITAYNEIKERHTHISTERDDILHAKSSLEQTISEIEETASNKFNEAIDAVRLNFKTVFQGLFSSDDDCDIVLINPGEPLETQIEIVAKPKGKRPTSINLLSGGEKALTAASFLFALYLLKPAPFCIFDEVDAPLDDVNIQKFNKLIRNFSKESQFIIITHNKLTMAEVDILYGVFLKEKGVSGVSAVDFRNYESAEILEAVE